MEGNEIFVRWGECWAIFSRDREGFCSIWRGKSRAEMFVFWREPGRNSLRDWADDELMNRRRFRVEGRGGGVVDGEGEQISRLRGDCLLVPDDGDVAVAFPHALGC